MDLHCDESAITATGECGPTATQTLQRGSQIKRAIHDRVLDDNRVLLYMLTTENMYVPHNYFGVVQSDIKPHMRKIVADWMLEVCEEQRCEDEVFPLSINIMDRFMCMVAVEKMQLQLLGACCMLIASKLKETSPMTAERIVQYTDNSITLTELMQMEMFVLFRLRWDVSAITPMCFLEQFISKLPQEVTRAFDLVKVKTHCQTFIALCATDVKFAFLPPSIVACGSLMAAINGLNDGKGSQDRIDINILTSHLHHLTSIEKEYINNCQEQIELTLAQNLGGGASVNRQHASHTSNEHKQLESTTAGQPTTPTDVRDIIY